MGVTEVRVAIPALPKSVLHHDPFRSGPAKATHANVKCTQDPTSQDGSSHSQHKFFPCGKLPHVQYVHDNPDIASNSAHCGSRSQHNGALYASTSHLSCYVLREIVYISPTYQQSMSLHSTKES